MIATFENTGSLSYLVKRYKRQHAVIYRCYSNAMKRNLIILFIFVNILGIRAQDKSHSFRLGVIYTADNYSGPKNFVVDRYTGYSAVYDKANFKVGLSAERASETGFSINSGIYYSNKDFTGTYYCYVCDFAVPPDPERIALRFIEIPFAFRYYFLPGKLKVYGEIGVNNYFSLTSRTFDDASYMLGTKLGGGIEYHLNKGFAIQLLGQYDKGLTHLYHESNFKIDCVSFGLGMVKRI